MVYPIVIFTFAGLVVIALVAFLVPVFEGVFKDFGGDLPPITKVTVSASHLITRQPYIPIAIVVGTVWGFRRWKNSKRGHEQWDRIKLRFPFKIGDVVQKVALARFARTYSALIAAGVPMLEAIEITGRTSGNVVVENAMVAVHESVRNGGTIAAPMRSEPDAFPGMVVQMVAVGEETGALDSMLSKIADFYEDEVEAAVKALTSILEPIMIIVVGGIVGFVVIAMYMPLFKVYDQIK
jgi:type IV pilus assembly protein PilC